MKCAVFLDRDGVINRAVVRDGMPHPPATLANFEILPDVPEALRALDEAGFLLVVVTNQPDVARGLQQLEVVEAMHKRLREELPLDDIKACYELDGLSCACYKPKPGMLLDAAREHNINLGRSYMVGDRWRDIDAGRTAGCTTIFIDNRYDERRPRGADITATSLADVVPDILRITMRNVTLHDEAVSALDPGNLKVEIFADGANLQAIVDLAANPLIKGFTTNADACGRGDRLRGLRA
jgi:D-glycero-D-manno-heptose 1,7-bisphosphate phosphatase